MWGDEGARLTVDAEAALRVERPFAVADFFLATILAAATIFRTVAVLLAADVRPAMSFFEVVVLLPVGRFFALAAFRKGEAFFAVADFFILRAFT
jgi:hypothetical protein